MKSSNSSFPSADFAPDLPFSFPFHRPQRLVLGILFPCSKPTLHLDSRCCLLLSPEPCPFISSTLFCIFPLLLLVLLLGSINIFEKHTKPNNLPLTVFLSDPPVHSLLANFFVCGMFIRLVVGC